MRPYRRPLFAAVISLAALLLVAPAGARDLTAAERDGLSSAVAEFNAAMRSGDAERLVDATPRKIHEVIAKQFNVSVARLRDSAIKSAEQTLRQVTFEAFSMDVAGAENRKTADGEPYLLLPTTTVMRLEDGSRVEAKSMTLAFLDGPEWRLVRVDQPRQAKFLSDAYPRFQGERFPPGAMRQLP